MRTLARAELAHADSLAQPETIDLIGINVAQSPGWLCMRRLRLARMLMLWRAAISLRRARTRVQCEVVRTPCAGLQVKL